MRGWSSLSAVFLSLGCYLSATASVEASLLASWHVHDSGFSSPPSSDLHLEILLEHAQFGPPYTIDARLGQGTWWQNGDTGLVEFSAGTDAAFAAMATLLTDGSDDMLGVFHGGAFGGTGHAWRETQWFGGSSDLTGFQLTAIGLTVHKVVVELAQDPRWGDDGVRHEIEVTYEFWGHPIPEPASLVLFLCAVAMLLRRRSGRVPVV